MSYVNGRIDRLEVENFKSYKGRQTIGPFKNFTAIIGPNGAGKSNLMDAISFVLGVRSMQLRGNQLRDLIYAYQDSDRDARGRKAFVKLVYLSGDGTELSFTRGITGAGASEYKINNKSATWDAYNEKMKSLGILVKARNFLVFQGDVESIASKSPKEMTTLFEQISGSEELKREYEELEVKKAKADEKAASCFQKKRGVAAERKQKKEQKEEAERHLQLQEELKLLKMDHYLWQLFDIERNAARTEEALQVDKDQQEELLRAQGIIQEEEKEVKKELASYQKENLVSEKKIAKKKLEIDKKQPELMNLKEEGKRVDKKLKAAHLALEKEGEKKAKRQADIARLERDLRDQEAMLDEVSTHEGNETLDLAESQLNEYNRIKLEADAKTSKLRADMETLVLQQKTDEDSLKNHDTNASAFAEREQQIRANIAKAQEVLQSSSESLEKMRKDLAAVHTKKTQMTDLHRKMRNRAEAAQKRLGEVEDRLREFKLDKHEMDRDAKKAETVANMQRLFPGVHGRMLDLVKVSQKKFNLALTVAMGKNMDAIVTDNDSVAKDCIKYLKEQHSFVMTFIPLQTVRVKPIQQRLRQIGGTAKLLLDVIDYAPEIENALLYACGNTLVCDTLEEARALAYGADRHRVVTIDGVEIHKGGNMTGGSSGGMEARAQRWDNRQVEELKQTRAMLQGELDQASNLQEVQQKEAEAESSIRSLEREMTMKQNAARHAEQKLKSSEQELQTILAEMKKREPEMEKLRASISAGQKKIEVLQKRANEIADHLFAEFSRSVGVASIREYEETLLKTHEEHTKRMYKLKEHIGKIQQQLKYERSLDAKSSLEKLESNISAAEAAVKKLREDSEVAHAAVDKAKGELEELEKAHQETKAKAEEVESKLQDIKERSSAIVKQQGKVKKLIGTKESNLDRLRTRQGEILETCELEQIKLPRVDGPGSEEPTPMDTDEAGPSTLLSVRPSQFDFSRLSRKHQQELQPGDQERLESEFKSKVEALQIQIDKTAPNLKALDQYEALRDKERDATGEFEMARREAKEVNDGFNAVKQQRYDRFMDAFSHISTVINQIYKELTQSATHPLGGTAYLTLENEDDPFLHGSKYTAMPPTKRFRDMEQLSGGEKTVAALALLFAIHSYRPSPFFVLDEVDAALDNLNVAKVANYIRKKSREEQMTGGKAGGFQGVVISLKDYFYDKADALVGVYRDCDAGCSKTLTFDLSEYSS